MTLSHAEPPHSEAATNSKTRTGRVAVWLERATLGCLFLYAVAAPHSIAGAQTAWLLGMLFWVARLLVRPRPALFRTPVDSWLLGFFVLTFLTALTSYNPDVSIGKLRAASLFTVVYLAAENVRNTRVMRALTLTLVASCALGLVHTFAVYAEGRGVKLRALTEDSTLRAVGFLEGDTILSVDGAEVRSPEDVVRAIEVERHTARERVYRFPDGKPSCRWDEHTACVRVYRAEAMPDANVVRDALPRGDTAEARLGILRWTRGRDERASGFYGQYQTYAEVLQLIASLALGLFVSLWRKLSLKGMLLGAALAGMCGALLLTVTRASWAGFLVSAFIIALVGASRRTLLVMAALALPLVIAGLFILQQKRQVGFIDTKEGSTAWRLMVWQEGARVLVSKPRHLLVGVGMDSLKRRWREWGMFDGGRQPWGHLHSTPLQIAFERGVPALLVWAAWLFVYGRMLWRLARGGLEKDRRGLDGDWVARGLALGALGGLFGFVSAGLVHYNFGDSEVVMVLYFVMGLALAAERLARMAATAQGALGPRVRDVEASGS
ncbi:MAG: hypothetical protein QOE46_1901 [Acidobacteriota bacterium]|jgi:O-antigen ligase|nr:hypothetical protein [Acidobacteriota bacterium]